MNELLLLTPGPVQVPREVLEAGAAPMTHHNAPEFQAVFQPLQASTRERVIGTVLGEDGGLWYQTIDYYYFPAAGVFLASKSDAFDGRWLLATLLPTTHVDAYEGQTFVRKMYALRGIPRENVIGRPLFVYWSFETPAGQYEKSSMGERVAFMAKVVLHFVDQTRWRRILHRVM